MKADVKQLAFGASFFPVSRLLVCPRFGSLSMPARRNSTFRFWPRKISALQSVSSSSSVSQSRISGSGRIELLEQNPSMQVRQSLSREPFSVETNRYKTMSMCQKRVSVMQTQPWLSRTLVSSSGIAGLGLP